MTALMSFVELLGGATKFAPINYPSIAWEYLSHGQLLQAIGKMAHPFEDFWRLIYYMREP